MSFGLRKAEKQLAPQPVPTLTRAAPVVEVAPAAPAAVAVAAAAAAVEPEPAVEAEVPVAAAVTAEAASDAVESEPDVEAEVPAVIADETRSAEVVDAVLTGNVDLANLEEMAKFKNALEYVEGIGPVYAGKLREIGLENCLDLLRHGATRKGREEIVEKSGVNAKLVLKWVNHVDLYRIKGVGSEYADLLEAAGVDTVVELAQRNPANLLPRMLEVNEAKNLVRRTPMQSQVDDWVAQAKELPRMVQY
jgi:predicted flap endonuclease-1-like 5' DNA nuclease